MRIITLACLLVVAGSVGAQGHAESDAAHGMGRGMGGMHSMVRHHYVMQEGLPEAFRELSSPLTATEIVLATGNRVYTENCSTCHGETGEGDGPAGAALDPPPSNIRRLPRMPMMSSDAYLYWTVAKGGAPVDSGMTAFEESLTADEIWSVIVYLRERL